MHIILAEKKKIKIKVKNIYRAALPKKLQAYIQNTNFLRCFIHLASDIIKKHNLT